MFSPTESIKGTIFDLQRFTIHDGPGIRTTVFFKGCPLRCVWCHNPEGLDSGPKLSFQPEKCVGCGNCLWICFNKAHAMLDGRHVLNHELCAACGDCAEACWARALELVGRDAEVDEIMSKVVRDIPFYGPSGGGLTLSGGEPLMQIDFAKSLLEAAGNKDIHRCVETCGAVPISVLDDVMPCVELFLFDVKDTNNARHIEYTGMSNRQILDNLRYLHDHGAKIILRLPFVPGFNDHMDHLDGIVALVGTLPNLCGVEIMPYHNIGLDKDRRFGLARTVDLSGESALPSSFRFWIDRLTAAGVKVMNTPTRKRNDPTSG